jgi:hypothetical protein
VSALFKTELIDYTTLDVINLTEEIINKNVEKY